MRLAPSLLFALPALAASIAASPDAAACGGEFSGETENTQVTGHRMIFSISPTATTLWDQFSYTGNPTSFAWVLPTKGVVTVGVSSDALFENLDADTQVVVGPPALDCPPPPSCYHGFTDGSSGASGTGSGGGGVVNVTAAQVVGPYQTVQLSSSDPNALTSWLTTNGYDIQPNFAPVVSTYVYEGFDFLAIKLVPGASVTAMQPVRITTPGAGASLPLRMVAAGVGASVPITLWIFGEGRYEATNFPGFLITEDQLVWDFAASSSNYTALKLAGFNRTNGRGWLSEASTPFSEYLLQNQLTGLVQTDPMDSGYGDATGTGAVTELNDDLAALWGNVDPNQLWVTRLEASLSRAALAADLTLGVSADQSQIPLGLTAKNAINTPVCTVYPPCPTSSNGGAGGATGNSTTGSGATGGKSGSGGAGGAGGSPSSPGGGCAVSGGEGDGPVTLGGLAALAALGLVLGRRRRAAR